MIQANDIEMISELSRIVEKHGADSVSRLARLIRDPDFANDLAAVLQNVADDPLSTKDRAGSGSVDRMGIRIMDRLSKSDPKKHVAVAEFRDRLLSGDLFRTMADIRQFARLHDLSIGKAASRKQAVVPLLRSISEWETAEIAALLESNIEPDDDDRSLRKWRELIVKPRINQDVGSTGQTKV